MKILALKLYGFKSFADKTTIKFDSNFIGVVGPNGSGKSNIIDAIKWVYGEQGNKSLRAGDSSDFIFSGSEKRSKLNFAEVTIVLDNSDGHIAIEYSQLEITRRVYRTGESEYLINGIECRLKDIVDLTLDSGIGKNTTSIISQGQVDEIVTAKPILRKALIEEVGGLVKYKKRKEATNKKLIQTKENLEKANLIIEEIAKSLNPLKKQADKAKKYEKFKNDLTNYEISLIAGELTKLIENREVNQAIKKGVETQKIALENKLLIDQNQILEIEQKIQDKDQIIHESNQQKFAIQNELNRLQNDYQLIIERKSFFENNDQIGRINTLKKQIVTLKEQLLINEQNVHLTEQGFNTVQDKITTIELSIQNLRQELNQKNNQMIDLRHQINNKSNVASYVQKVLDTYELQGINDLVKNSYSTEGKYLEAIDVALGGRNSEIIVDQKIDAINAINYIKQKKLGRMSFLPIDLIKVYTINENDLYQVKNLDGFVGIAADLVKTSEKYKNVFNSLLGRIIIATDLKTGTNIFEKSNKKYRIVTLTGEVISPTGVMSGGNFKQKNVKVIELEYENLKVEVEKIQEDITNKQNSLSQYYQEKQESFANLEFIQNKVKNLKQELESTEAELNELDETRDDNEINLSSKISEMQKNLAEIDLSLVQKIEVRRELNENRENINNKLREDNQELRMVLDKEHEVSNKLTELEIKIENKVNFLMLEYGLTYELANSRATQNIDFAEYKKIVDDIRQEIKKLGPVNIDAIEEVQEYEERYNFMNDQIIDLQNAHQKLTAIIVELDQYYIERFKETYKKMRNEFKIIFEELFGGGKADLILTDPENILETGVEIIAQPPGKKLQTISLLSGGEKALTAIALIMTKLRVNSVPYVILDEVEAALDEANVQRYARYLKLFSENVQFIIITHRQGTMAQIDRLYGVTMQERGVSTILDVKFEEINEKIQLSE